MKHIMIDLETMGTKSNAAIVSIGAVCFDEKEGLGPEFYARVDLQSAVDYGGRIDPSTVLWWLQQSDEARFELWASEGKLSIYDALQNFTEFCKANKPERFWGNGADFDNTILGTAYENLGLKKPWSYAQNCCFRTLKHLFKEVERPAREGVHHNALDDAKFQAVWALKILQYKKYGTSL